MNTKTLIALTGAAVCSAALAMPAAAASQPFQITSTTADNGQTGSFDNAGFWTVGFNAASGLSISSITIDLNQAGRINPGFFDLDGKGNAGGPSVTSGLSSSDVSFSGVGERSDSLTLDFAEGAFAGGDTLVFMADTDRLRHDNAMSVGFHKVGFTVTLSDGQVLTTNYAIDGDGSIATILGTFGAAAPTPAAAAMGLLLIGGCSIRRRRKA